MNLNQLTPEQLLSRMSILEAELEKLAGRLTVLKRQEVELREKKAAVAARRNELLQQFQDLKRVHHLKTITRPARVAPRTKEV